MRTIPRRPWRDARQPVRPEEIELSPGAQRALLLIEHVPRGIYSITIVAERCVSGIVAATLVKEGLAEWVPPRALLGITEAGRGWLFHARRRIAETPCPECALRAMIVTGIKA